MLTIHEVCKIMNDKKGKIILNRDSKMITGTFLGPKARKILSEELDQFYIPPSYSQIQTETVLIEGVPYYCKCINEESLIAELIGPYLCKKLELESVDNQIGIDSSNTWCCLSKIFYEEKYQYKPVINFFYEDSQDLLDYNDLQESLFELKWKPLKFYRNMPKLYDDVLKLVAVDLKMGQTDRRYYNLQIKVDSIKENSLAPIYDFGNAYLVYPFKEYANPFLAVKNNFFSLSVLFFHFPKLLEYVEYLMEFPMSRILRDIESERNIEITQDLKTELEKVERNCEKSIRKIKRVF